MRERQVGMQGLGSRCICVAAKHKLADLGSNSDLGWEFLTVRIFHYSVMGFAVASFGAAGGMLKAQDTAPPPTCLEAEKDAQGLCPDEQPPADPPAEPAAPTVIAGDLAVIGNAAFGGDAIVSGLLAATNNLTVGGTANGGAQRDSAVVINTDTGALDRGLVINVPGASLSGIDIAKSVFSGNYLRIIGPDGRPTAQFGSGGQLELVSWVTISGVIQNTGDGRVFLPPTDRPYMLAVYSDVFGPTAVFRSNQYAGRGGESWPASFLSGLGRERLRIDDDGSLLFGNISGNDVAGEKLQLRAGWTGSNGLYLRTNDARFAPGHFLVASDGWYGAVNAAGAEVDLLGLLNGQVRLGNAATATYLSGNAIIAGAPLTLASTLSANAALTSGSLAFCTDCGPGGAVAVSNGQVWDALATTSAVQRVDSKASTALTLANGALAVAADANGKLGRFSVSSTANAASASGEKSIAIGGAANAGFSNSVAIGEASSTSAANALALGVSSSVSAANAVALGFGSVADQANTVSVGSADVKRRIVNVAAGVNPGDAVNVEQLNRAVSGVSGELSSLKTNVQQAAAAASGAQITADNAIALATRAGNSADQAVTAARAAQTTADEAKASAANNAAKLGFFAVNPDGDLATASGLRATSIGVQASAQGSDTLAIGSSSTSLGQAALAVGRQAAAKADNAIAVGSQAGATALEAVSIGTLASASANYALSLGSQAISAGAASIALGQLSQAASDQSVALGAFTSALAQGAIAIGGDGVDADSLGASASKAFSVAIGVDAAASAQAAVALGSNSVSSGAASLALGNSSRATGTQAVAVGDMARADGDQSLAMGRAAVASGERAIAIGNIASSDGSGALAIGARSLANGIQATALGAGATASFAGSTAVGQNATTTAAQQITLGGEGSSVRIGDVAASTAAQVGPVEVVTVDANGTLGRRSISTTASAAPQLEALTSGINTALAISQTQFDGLQSQFDGLQGRVSTLFDLAATDRKDSRQGVAAVAALANPAMPSEPGRTSYAANVATYRGEFGVSAGLMHRFDTSDPFAITAGVSYAGGKNTVAKVGVAGEF